MKIIEKNGRNYCPECGSSRVYVEVSVMARQLLNTFRIYNYSNNIDNTFYGAGYGCEKCGWTGGDEEY